MTEKERLIKKKAESSPTSDKKTKNQKKSRPPPPSESPQAVIRTGQYIGAGVAALAVALALTHVFVKAPINAVEYKLPDPIPLPEDNRLSAATILLEDEIYGPESIAVNHKTGQIFAGLKTGLICEIKIGKKDGKARIINAVRLTSHEGCDGSYTSQPKCGRPLGLRTDDFGRLIVVDAYLGVFLVNWKNSSVESLVKGGAQITDDNNAPPIRYLNDVTILPDGRLVLSESSVKFDDRDFLYDILEHRPNGRLVAYDPKTSDLTVLVDGLYFPNGLTIFKGQVIIAEMGTARLLKYSPSRNSITVIADNLPGYPDNIRTAHDGNLWVPLGAVRDPNDNWLAERPRIREMITKVLSPQALHFVGDYFSSAEGIVLKVSPESGKILEVYRDPSHKVTSISIAIEDGKGGLLLGSDTNYYLARLVLDVPV